MGGGGGGEKSVENVFRHKLNGLLVARRCPFTTPQAFYVISGSALDLSAASFSEGHCGQMY